MDRQDKPNEELQNETGKAPEQESEFSFIQETIKSETIDAKTKGRRLIHMAVLGIVFGLCTGIGFSAIKPWAERTFSSNKTQITIPEDKDDPEEETDQEGETGTQPVTEENLQQVYDQLRTVGEEASKSMVVITRKTEGADWTDNDPANQVSGLIIANNGQDFLILVPDSIQEKAESYTAAFVDGNEYGATVKVSDSHFGYAIMTVPVSEVRSSTKNRITVAALGNSNVVKAGDVVVAVGSQFGHKDDMGYGIISSVQNSVNKVDCVYSLITTDIPCAANSTGVLWDQNGQAIGLINSQLSEESGNISNAYAISRVKAMIEVLSNGKEVPYVGINGTDVTSEIAQQQNLPKGVFVTEVGTESAGAEAGIKSGDVITSVNGEKVESLRGYHNELMKCNVGDKIKIVGQRLGSDGYVDITFSVTLAGQ